MTERDSQPGGDPIGDLQRWLMRSGARSLTKDITAPVRRALGQEPSGKRADVWETATTRPLRDEEAPECAWCPVCRAARKLRESRQGAQGSPLAGAGDALASVVQEAYSAFESVMKPPQHPRPQDRPSAPSGFSGPSASSGPSGSAGPSASSGSARPSASSGPSGSAGSSWSEATDPPGEAGRAPDDRH